MAHFVIVGKKDCVNFAHAIDVAEYLMKKLPRFKFRTIIIPEEDWPIWLDQLNSTNGWHETQSPIIWKEISRRGGKAYLIGGLSEFWEYCYDYYGFQSKLSKNDLEQIMADNIRISSSKAKIKSSNITITSATNHIMLQFLIYEIQNCITLKKNERMVIKLYDNAFDNDLEKEDTLLSITDDYKDIFLGIPQNILVVGSISEALQDCDLFIIVDDYGRNPGESMISWLERCRNSMRLLADDINLYANRDLKIILNQTGPICFNASVLMEYCTTIALHNIVAITADESINLISMMAGKCEEPVENLWCPPVWGFSGITSFVTLDTTRITTKVYKPFKRTVNSRETANMPKGLVQLEMRFLGNVLNINDELEHEIEKKKKIEKSILNRDVFLPKIRALSSLLKLWFAKEIGDEIISLGVCSNGTFNLPAGVCFSQAVSLSKERIWEPYSKLYLHHRTHINSRMSSMILNVEKILEKFELGEKFHPEEDL